MTDDFDKEFKNADRRINTIKKLEEYIVNYVDHHVEGLEGLIAKWIRRGLIACGVIAVACIVALVGFGVALHQIQASRRFYIQQNCKAQNDRHDKTIMELRKSVAHSIKRTPQFAKQIRDGVADSVDLINALAPKQNCVQLTRVALGKTKTYPGALGTTEAP